MKIFLEILFKKFERYLKQRCYSKFNGNFIQIVVCDSNKQIVSFVV